MATFYRNQRQITNGQFTSTPIASIFVSGDNPHPESWMVASSGRKPMASYLGHLTFSSALGAAYGSAGVLLWGMDWGPAFLGAGLTTLGGLLPDLDSGSGVPVRELFGIGAVIVPLLLIRRLVILGF